MFDLINRFKYALYMLSKDYLLRIAGYSAIDVDGNGRIDKASVLQALQSKGESYDHVRETLKHVSVDASGKVELEDWVEARCIVYPFLYVVLRLLA